MDTKADFERRWMDVSAQVNSACERSGRSPDEVRVIGVTKTVSSSALNFLLDVGVRDFGENRWQHARELLQHPRAKEATWHFIGHLQTNKVKYIVPNFAFIHSVDSVDLLSEVEHQAERFDRDMYALIQVNISGEETKYGIEPDEVRALLEASFKCSKTHVIGLMTMAPAGATESVVREVFRSLAALRKDLQQSLGLDSLTELSMGMSDDFEWAIEEGATMIRVGRRLMGG
ncbi:YggS family pyridoxal phosphate-dependent enzyme [Alicyclobacillus mengziensis]|uniref:Pyridoxal phosphate homeostasis protein n=1 Tax=Alicyclobacillus mengziensis TaxID=2931921 RepID=A0A9X7W4D7_9BACL|nr:YggS family pyridoxal phosphate-dependent enzyme [Alicyclobacillus mengziensis]QSO49478.1 YggS family pyridoxal phosphate-dependent enzyme [Alicyclobacillus mengziensis]